MSGNDKLKHLPLVENNYLRALIQNIQAVLESNLVGIYLFGSGASSAYHPGVSDLDVMAVISAPLPREKYDILVSQISHINLPCPARKLEFVLYTLQTVNDPNRKLTFEINFNTGQSMGDHVAFDIADEPSFWFLLDISMGRQLGEVILGDQDMKHVFGEPEREVVVRAILQSVTWFKERIDQEEKGEREKEMVDGILNACRGWRWSATGIWGSKVEGGEWVIKSHQNVDDVKVVTDALNARRGDGSTIDGTHAIQLLENIQHIICEGARNVMEPFLKRKVEEMKERKLVEWSLEAAKSRLAEVIFDFEVG